MMNVTAAHPSERSLQEGTSRLAASRSSPPWTPGVTDPALYSYDTQGGFDDREPNPLARATPPRSQGGRFSGRGAAGGSPGEQPEPAPSEDGGNLITGDGSSGQGGAAFASSDEDPNDQGYDTPAQERIQAWRDFFEDPESSFGAGLLSMAILGLICVSTVALVVETDPTFNNTEDKRDFFILESCCIGMFTIEYVTRLILAERRCEFVQHGMNLIDVISIVPFWVDLLLWAATGDAPYKASGGASDLTRVLRLFRLVRVFRVFKLGRNSKSLLIAFRSVMASLDTLGLMIFILFIMLVLFGAFVYNFEIGEWEDTCTVAGVQGGCYKVEDDLGEESVSLFISIPEAMWWCVVTVMTVGYGDIYPVTPGGKFFAAVCMVSSIVILALPISVIGINFSAMWSADEESVIMKNDCHKLSQCGSVVEKNLGSFIANVHFYLHQLRTIHRSVRNRSEALIADLSEFAGGIDSTASPDEVNVHDGVATTVEMKSASEPPSEGSPPRGDGMLLSPTVNTIRRAQASSQLFALKTDEVCMQAIYERVMCFFPLQRVHVGESYEPREEASVGVQRMLRRTSYNGKIILRLAEEVDKVEKELLAMKRFVNCDLPPTDTPSETDTES